MAYNSAQGKRVLGRYGGGEDDYMEPGGEPSLFTNKTLRYITANLAWFANLLATNPIGTNLLEEDKKAEAESGEEE